MKNYIIIITSLIFFIGFACTSNKTCENKDKAKKELYEKNEALAATDSYQPKKALNKIKKPSGAPVYDKKVSKEIIDKEKAKKPVTMVLENTLVDKAMIESPVISVSENTITLEKGYELTLNLPEQHRIIKNLKDRTIACDYIEAGVEGAALRSVKLYEKEKPLLFVLDLGGVVPVKYTVASLSVVQTKKEIIVTENESEKIASVETMLVLNNEKKVPLAKGRTTEIELDQTKYLVTLSDSYHVIPKETGDAFEGPTFRLQLILSIAE